MRHSASSAEATPGRIGRGGRGEARTGNNASRGRSHREQARLRLKTWSKKQFSTPHRTGQHHRPYFYSPVLVIKSRRILTLVKRSIRSIKPKKILQCEYSPVFPLSNPEKYQVQTSTSSIDFQMYCVGTGGYCYDLRKIQW